MCSCTCRYLFAQGVHSQSLQGTSTAKGHSKEWWQQCMGLLLHEGYLQFRVTLAEEDGSFIPISTSGMPAHSTDGARGHTHQAPSIHMSKNNPLGWDFRLWGRQGMGAWQTGSSTSNSGPSQEAHASHQLGSRGSSGSGADVVDADGLSRRRVRIHRQAADFEEVPFVASKCAVAVTSKGLHFLSNTGERMERLLPR